MATSLPGVAMLPPSGTMHLRTPSMSRQSTSVGLARKGIVSARTSSSPTSSICSPVSSFTCDSTSNIFCDSGMKPPTPQSNWFAVGAAGWVSTPLFSSTSTVGMTKVLRSSQTGSSKLGGMEPRL